MYKCSICTDTFNKKNYFDAHNNMHVIHEEYLIKFVKYSLDDIEYINNVPKVVFVCWFGGYGTEIPEMSQNRFNCFKNLTNNIGIPIILITSINYKKFIKSGFPIHKSFEYLTGVHKTDYFRCYLMNHYGGGYHDIKSRSVSWINEWEKDNWLYDDDIWIYGCREKNENAIGYPPGMSHIKKEFEKMVTMGWIICKKNTPFTKKILKKIHLSLDTHYQKLKKYPGIRSGGYYSDKPFDLVPKNSYPIRWLEILGEIFHPLMLKFTNHIKFGLPAADKSKRYK